ncbi:substrate-binding domain-containing protein [Lonsdalea britannica]|uniref:substrate-binding domain-containing protein n=1 Tax=Lonsdalea britannica TaxID=1082704 RepID=UPI0026EE8E4D|nr:substrate-binding domain-containing protein [Lonsdalea britannica]
MSQRPLQLLAAGSLRGVWPALMAAFEAKTGLKTQTAFGPAGLLRQRIEQGEPCDLFASANRHHTTALVMGGLALSATPLAVNRLCLTASASAAARSQDWLTLLLDPELRLATSTPGSDPSGDYAWQLFEQIERHCPGAAAELQAKALMLVGGPTSTPVPEGHMAAAWTLQSGQADLFVGYASYAPRLRLIPGIHVFSLPDDQNIRADYTFALCRSEAQPLAEFLSSAVARQLLLDGGFEVPVLKDEQIG